MNVVDPLPLVEARIEVAPTCVTRSQERGETPPPQKEAKTSAASAKSQAPAAVALTKATVLKGQVLSWCIHMTNTGEAI